MHFLSNSCTSNFPENFSTYFSSLYPPNELWVMPSSASRIDSRSEVVKEPCKIPVCAGLGQRCGGNWPIIQRW
jgi:hypothetical protein